MSRCQQPGLLLCCTVFQSWGQGFSLVRTLWEPPRFGAPAEQPRESLYSWGRARTTSPTLTLSPGTLSKHRVSLHGGSVPPGEGPSSPACPHDAVLILSVVHSLASLHPWPSYVFPLKHPVGGKQGNPSYLFQVGWDCVQSSDT